VADVHDTLTEMSCGGGDVVTLTMHVQLGIVSVRVEQELYLPALDKPFSDGVSSSYADIIMTVKPTRQKCGQQSDALRDVRVHQLESMVSRQRC